MMPIARALLLGLLVAWPLQPLDDAMRAWVKAHQDPGMHAFMGVVSSKSRVVLISGAVLGLAAGASGRAAGGAGEEMAAGEGGGVHAETPGSGK